jgi:predicted RNase H-like nuclease (RuvC/YqgF family)
MVYLESRPEMPNDRVGLRSFKHLIRNKIDEIEELEDELQKVKEGKGMIPIEEHNSGMDSLRKQIKIQAENIEDLEFKLKEQRKFFEDKMNKQDEIHNSFKKNFTDKLNEDSAN